MTETAGLVQQFVEGTGQLYSLPAVAAEVLRLTGEPRIDPQALKECIERDPALTTRLLRVVNSSLFGLSRPVTDLSQTLALLGIRPLKMLVLGFSLPKELFSGLESSVLANYWRRSLIKAVAARELAERLWKTAGDEAFIAGLVQDIGMLVLIQQLGDSYQRFLRHLQMHGGNLLAAELDSLGFDHLMLSARLLAHWGLPASLSAAVAVPPDEARIEAIDPIQRTLPQILHLADLLARLIEQPYGSALRDLLASGGRYRGLTYDTLRPIVEVLQQKVETLAEVLALELPDGTGYVDLLVAAQQSLAVETVTAAIALATPQAEDKLLALTQQMRRELAQAASPRRMELPLPAATSPAPRGAAPGRGPLPARQTRDSAVLTAAPAPSESGLAGRVGAAIHRCRHSRCPLTLAFFELERFSDVLLQLGPAGAFELTHWLRVALRDWTGQPVEPAPVSDSCLAHVWEACCRSDAVRLARQVLAEVKPWSRRRLPGGGELTLSAGLATLEFPPKNYPPQDLIDATQRCLTAARLSGGDTVKSIEL